MKISPQRIEDVIRAFESLRRDLETLHAIDLPRAGELILKELEASLALQGRNQDERS